MIISFGAHTFSYLVEQTLTLEQAGGPKQITGDSSRFDSLLTDLIAKKPGYSRERVLELVKEKRAKVGAGYLTDQGALFLVASDLNVALKFDPTPTRAKLSELQSDQREVSVIARIISIGIPRRFEKDSREGFLLKILLCDDSKKTTQATVWDYKVGLKIISSFSPGALVKITNCYTRAGIDGTPVLNIADTSEISSLDEGNAIANSIPLPKDLVVELDSVSVGSGSQIVRGVVAEAVKRMQFTRAKDNSQSHFLSFSLNSSESSQKRIRVVIWGNSNPVIEKLAVGEAVSLGNVRPKMSGFQGSEEIELHGDDSTIVLEKWDETLHYLSQEMKSLEKYFQKSSDVIQKKASPQTLPFVARIVSTNTPSRESAAHFLLIDSRKRKISLTVLEDAASDAGGFQIDDVVLCKPDTFDEMGLRAVCKKKDSLSKLKPERKDIPLSDSLVSAIENIEPGAVVSVDAMTLAESVSREIQTKDGSLVRRSEVSLTDPSGEIMLFAWRSLSKTLEGLKPGIRLWVRAAEVQSHEGRKFLLLKNYSRIERKEEI